MVLDRVRPGGLIVADNVLWSGKVINTQVPDNDKDTISLKAFNDFIFTDKRVEKLLLPIRDGVFVIRKKDM
jgi:predicted O-methyltransferase YrrM